MCVLGTASAAFHTVRGTQFHGLQLKAEGQETLTVWYAYLQRGMCVVVCYVAKRDAN